MSTRFAALLCLLGTAACSHDNTQPAASADDVYQSNTASTEPAMTPASLETNRPGDSASATTATPGSPSSTDATSPTVAEDSNAVHRPLGAGSDAPRTDSGASQRGVQPDNTKVNERDTNAAAPTPGAQRENETDLKITQHVRQAVMADGSLSFTAKNVKIITQNGKVTLRGPVKTAAERTSIEAAARKVAGVTQIDNQIEVAK